VARIVKTAELEDARSPRCARYTIIIRQLTQGYSIETCWGGVTGHKAHEQYYRETLTEAQGKFAQILAAKTSKERKSNRHYRTLDQHPQLRLDYYTGSVMSG